MAASNNRRSLPTQRRDVTKDKTHMGRLPLKMSADQKAKMGSHGFLSEGEEHGPLTPPPDEGDKLHLQLPTVLKIEDSSWKEEDSTHPLNIAAPPETVSSLPETSQTGQPQEKKIQLPGARIIPYVVCFLAGLWGLHQIEVLFRRFVSSIIPFCLRFFGIARVYRLITKILKFNVFSLFSSTFEAFIELVIRLVFPTVWLDYWMFPTDNGFELDNTTFGESLEVLRHTFFVLGATLVVKYIYDHTDPSLFSVADDMQYNQPYDMRIGAFDEESREEAEENCLFSPSRSRTISDVEISNLEDGIVRRRVRFIEPSASKPAHGQIRKSNPAVPLSVDFAGAGYPGVVAGNQEENVARRNFHEDGEKVSGSCGVPSLRSVSDSDYFQRGLGIRSTQSPETSMPQPPSAVVGIHKIPRKPLPRSYSATLPRDIEQREADIGIGGHDLKRFGVLGPEKIVENSVQLELQALRNEHAMPHQTSMKIGTLSREIDTFEKGKEERRVERLKDDEELQTRLKKYDHDEAARKGHAASSRTIDKGQAASSTAVGEKSAKKMEDLDEATIRRAFPDFVSVVSRPSDEVWQVDDLWE